MPSILKSYILILRPSNVAITFFSVLVIVLIGKATANANILYNAVMAALSAGFICGGANAVNDYFDIEIDKINKPDRVLAEGRLTKAQALAVWLLSSIAGLVLSFFVNSPCFFIALFAVAV
jgi:geranylgeranylglycerol-phosphate geranylgeranyltransferase